ncbi:MAG: CPBP family intramembrane metalloprotease [Candidatus Riflebacteria bacterium]|nr:CPBP family intramembrane metalloprotease [Candidatus Riflebacteria bacterium]
MLRITIAALSLGLLFTLRGPPTTYVPVPAAPTAAERLETARRFLLDRGEDLTGFTARQVMIEHEKPVLYLQKTLGPEGLVKRLEREELPLFYWQVHLSRPGDQRQYWVRVTLKGSVGAFSTKLPETDAGQRPGVDPARSRARAFLAERFSLAGWKEVEAATTVLPGRTDHRFVFARELDRLENAQERVSVTVQGGRIGGYRNWVKVPETHDLEQSAEETYADALFWTSVTADVLLVLAAAAVLLVGCTRGTLPGTAPARAALLVFVTLLITIVNYAPVTLAKEYSPEKPLIAFLGSQLLFLALLGAIPAVGTFLMLAAGEIEDGQTGSASRVESFRRWLDGRWADPLVRRSMGLGLLMGVALGGGEAIFYHIGQLTGTVTLPVGPRYVNTMGTWLPFLFPLSIGIGAGITEECTFRLFATTFLSRKVPRSLALLVPAMAWAFAHSKESVYPVWARGSELVIGGVLLGWFFLSSDLLAVITAHYLYDVVTFGWAMLGSSDPVAVAGTVLCLGVVVVPGALGLKEMGPVPCTSHRSSS